MQALVTVQKKRRGRMRVGPLWEYGVRWLSLAPVALMLRLQYFTYFPPHFWDGFPSLSIKKLKPGAGEMGQRFRAMFDFQHTHGGSLPSVALFLGNKTPSFGL